VLVRVWAQNLDRMVGPWLVSIGYGLAVIGGALLFLNTPPDVGGTHALMIPVVNKFDTGAESDAIRSRQTWNRIGFALLTIGALLQLGGYWADRFRL
jgi:hypothetical protein